VTPIYISERLRALLLGAVAVALILMFWAAPAALLALGGGTFLAVLLSIPVNALDRVMPRALAVVAVFLLMIGLLGAVLFFVLPPLVSQLGEAIAAAPAFASQLDAFLRTQVLEPLQQLGLIPEDVDEVLSRLYQALLRAGTDVLRGLLDWLLGSLSGVANAGLFAVTLVVITIYFLLDARRMKAGFLRSVPRRYRWDARALWEALGRNLSRIFLASIASNTIQGLVAFVGLTLIGVPFAALLGAVMWLTAFVPLFGSWLGAIPALLVALTVSPLAVVFTGILYLGINLLDGNVLTPRLQGTALSVHPVVVLVAVLIAGQLLGLAGVVVTMPILAAVSVMTGFLLDRLRVRPRVSPVAIVSAPPQARRPASPCRSSQAPRPTRAASRATWPTLPIHPCSVPSRALERLGLAR
jgi:predicted PurR-regulated permease PerM